MPNGEMEKTYLKISTDVSLSIVMHCGIARDHGYYSSNSIQFSSDCPSIILAALWDWGEALVHGLKNMGWDVHVPLYIKACLGENKHYTTPLLSIVTTMPLML